MMPQRIQRRRTAGWRMPDGCVYVGRPTKYGNPFTIANCIDVGYANDKRDAREWCVMAFRSWLIHGMRSPWWFLDGVEQHGLLVAALPELTGHDLACWCSANDTCHADVLLEMANA